MSRKSAGPTSAPPPPPLLTNKERLAARRGDGRAKDDSTLDDPAWKRLILPASATASFGTNADRRERAFRDALAHWEEGHEDPRNRVRAAALARHVSYVPSGEFMAELGKSLEWLKARLRGKAFHLLLHVTSSAPVGKRGGFVSDPDHLLKLVPKSTAWLAHYVTAALTTSKLYGLVLWNGHDVLADVTHANVPWGGRNIVVVDDATYSGKQLSETVRDLARHIRRNAERGAPRATIWVIVPFRTWKAQKRLRFAAEEFSRDPAVQIVVQEEHRKMGGAAQAFEDSDVVTRRSGAALTVFEHKVPDGLSFPAALFAGKAISGGMLGDADGYGGNYGDNNKGAAAARRRPFVAQDDPKPYGMKVPGVVRHVRGGFMNDTPLAALPRVAFEKAHSAAPRSLASYAAEARIKSQTGDYDKYDEPLLLEVVNRREVFSEPLRAFVKGLLSAPRPPTPGSRDEARALEKFKWLLVRDKRAQTYVYDHHWTWGPMLQILGMPRELADRRVKSFAV
jgi:hypothetical protein